MDLTLESNIQYLPRVGPSKAKLLNKLGIFTVSDLLYYPPFRYNDFSLVSPISQVQPGETVTVSGEIKSHINLMTKSGRKMQLARIMDASGSIDVVWFNQTYLLSVLRPGTFVHLAGTVNWFSRKIALISPDYEIIDLINQDNSLHTGRLVPIYSETEGVTSKWLRARTKYIIDQGLSKITDFLPEEIISGSGLISHSQAIESIHFPKSFNDVEKAKRRMSFEEMFILHLHAQIQRQNWQKTQKSFQLNPDKAHPEKFIRSLPFQLTGDQLKVISEIISDLNNPYPMNRLIVGDVGSGKTVVAAAIMYIIYVQKKQSVIMAPTQILAFQHYQTLSTLFKPYNISVDLITGTKKTQTGPLLSKTPVIVGTHALLSKSVKLDNIALIVIDEQQRFGVTQRQLLRDKSTSLKTPHLLTMTATPIPRSMALTLYGNLDLSVINQMPKGRNIVKTWVVPESKRQKAYDWIRNQISQTQAQVFVVCPLIEESESLLSVKSAKAEFDRLKNHIFTDLKLDLLHGRLKNTEKNTVLEKFRNHESDILIATPVVEVGIDIPGATIMVIEAPERFGLAQLHQLRGRVGRRNQQAYCLLFITSDDEISLKRLKALESVHNGPELSEIDLSIRGPGEVFGTAQHGLPKFKFADFSDTDLIYETQREARKLLMKDPELDAFSLLRQKLNQSTIDQTAQS